MKTMRPGIKTLVLFTCLPYLCFQVVYNGLLSASVSSIQTRYLLSGVDVGIIIGMVDLGSVFTLILVMYVGEDADKPKWLGINSMLIGLGALIFTIPNFTAPAYQYKTSDFVNYCENVTEPDCVDKGLKQYMGVFILGMLFVGAGYSSVVTYGITYIDDNSTTRQSSFYVSVFYVMSALGSTIGFISGGATTKLFVNPSTKDIDIDSTSPFWVGAWWPMFIVIGILLIIFGFPIFKMPKKLPGAINKVYENKGQAKENQPKEENKMTTKFGIIKELIVDPIFLMTTLVNALSQAFVMGFSSFGIKYTEAQFGLSTFLASVAYGTTGVICITLGNMTSGIIMDKYNLKIVGLIKYCTVLAFISVHFTFGFFFYCEDDSFAGGTVNYSTDNDSITKLQLNSSCNAHCGCTADWYNPVRGSDGITYYSPCYAGCQLVVGNNGTYDDCLCISTRNSTSTSHSGTAEALESVVDQIFCVKLIGFAVSFGLAIYTSILIFSPNMQITIRHVGDDRKSTAIATQQLVSLCLGNIPGRVLTGKVIDHACVVWSTKCGETASCKIYDKWNMALYSFILLVVETSVIFITLLTMLYKYNLIKNHEKQAEQSNAEKLKHQQATSIETVASKI